MASSTDNIDKTTETTLKQAAVDKRRLYDKIATALVTSGGIAVIFSIIAILFFIAIVAVPLWESPEYRQINSFNINTGSNGNAYGDNVLAVGTDQYREIVFLFHENGTARFISSKDGKTISELMLEGHEETSVTSSYVADNNRTFAAGTAEGTVYSINTSYKITVALLDKIPVE